MLSIMKNLTSDISVCPHPRRFDFKNQRAIDHETQFDTKAVAEECGYKDTKTLNAVWWRLKKKKLGVTGPATPAKKLTPGKKRKESAADDGDVGCPTPTKKARTPKAKKEEPVVKDEAGSEDGEE